MSEDGKATPRDIARDEAISQLVSFGCYLALTGLATWALMHRDMLWRARRRAVTAWKARHADPFAREIAEFRREINDLSRGTAGPDTTRQPGLYERGGQ